MFGRTARSEFETVVLPHLDAAANLARWLVGDAVAAEDVVQTAILRALTYFPGWRGENPRAWLLSIVRNAAYAWLAERRGGREVPFDDNTDEAAALPDPAPDPETAVARIQALQRLDAALATLPAELRECLVLRELEEMSYRDIAQVTGVPIGTVMSRLWRGRRLLLRAAQGGAA